VTTYKSISAILISLINPKVIAVVGTVLGAIIDLIFLPSTVTVVVIVLYSEVFSTYILT
jgi:threonine/homoserine/homoserine lactone efflux protein